MPVIRNCDWNRDLTNAVTYLQVDSSSKLSIKTAMMTVCKSITPMYILRIRLIDIINSCQCVFQLSGDCTQGLKQPYTMTVDAYTRPRAVGRRPYRVIDKRNLTAIEPPII